MKMVQQAGVVGEAAGLASSTGGGTVVVGVKLDAHSRELLTWALVKVALPGDTVIALHVLGNNEIVDRDGKSSLLSLVKTFDSVLAVYEGFCNLKQVDLKLKICRGTSIRKILVKETNSCSASKVIVGTARNYHTIRSSTSVAKYCAKKLSKEITVLAVNNGKVVYQREGLPSAAAETQGTEDNRRNCMLDVIHRSISLTKHAGRLKNSQVVTDDAPNSAHKSVNDTGSMMNLERALVKAGSDCLESAGKQKCPICGPAKVLPEDSYKPCEEDLCGNGGDCEGESLAIVPVQKAESPSASITLLIRQLPEARPGWPLLRQTVLTEKQAPGRSSLEKISVVQWALRLPSRQPALVTDSDHKQTNKNSTKLPNELEGLHEKYSATCRPFKYQELLSATSNFLAENLIGKGGSSQVYKGCLPDGKELAVKILKSSEDVLKEFILEIDIITTLHHKNIISLSGFCFEENNLLLVYDFLSRGSLEENLHGNKIDPHLFGWSERYKVAVGVAEALDYLHSGSAQHVIHRDVKSSNILLSNDFEPQLSDFGLAKWASTSASHITCKDVSGTFGYLAPEYFMYGKVNDSVDVYAFGVVLLELLSGRKPISNDYPKGQKSLVIWAKPILYSGKITQLLDPTLGSNYDHDQMERMALAAVLCIRRAARARPKMSLVLKLLQGDTDVTKWARLQINASEEFEMLDDEACPRLNLQSHLNLALLDVEDDSFSMSSIEQSVSVEDYLQGRWSRSSSFD
ncbi:probable receptor-like serine/threonine-protein kinase At5g57670 isoform X1 [Mangifera indica]|uniref:probable receptor-like serine/threonine-protein kinase At5g57670 isoform X1 n=1 Tax=Mangifera indica TaxID=29780 RepID=UPI001CFA913A|nr:probable receptor-like serine/threonine-protein kinase At5g57670 isoform X1 [Mangifera indica]